MGNQCCHSDLTNLPNESSLQTKIALTNSKDMPLISPKKSIALKTKQTSLDQICPQLIALAERIKTEQNFQGMQAVVQNCPIYYMQNIGCFYQGQWEDQLPHGCGIAVYKNMSYYQGEFQKGELQSDGGLYVAGSHQLQTLKNQEVQTKIQPKPTYYVGRFEKSKFSGKGKMHHRGVIYQGEWEQGRRQGEGRQYTSKGSYTYQGSFANGFKYGHGTYQCKINDQLYSYQGSFYCGLIHGKGRLQIEHKLCFSGYFLNGRAQGEGTLVCDLGVLKCNFSKDRVSGTGEFVFNDQEKGKLVGEFTDEIVQELEHGEKMGEMHGERQRVVRKVFCGREEVSEGSFIDFRALMADN